MIRSVYNNVHTYVKATLIVLNINICIASKCWTALEEPRDSEASCWSTGTPSEI